ncbi:MAG: histidine kinase dimerization/phospho-acceptor domain-containing protein, partial [Planctomycetota bacterium]
MRTNNSDSDDLRRPTLLIGLCCSVVATIGVFFLLRLLMSDVSIVNDNFGNAEIAQARTNFICGTAAGIVFLIILFFSLTITLWRSNVDHRQERAAAEMLQCLRSFNPRQWEQRINRPEEQLPETLSAVFSQFSRIIEIMRSTAARQSGDYDRLQLVLRQMNDGVMLLDEQQNIVLANAAARGLLQMRQTDPEGRTLLEVARFPRLSEAVASVVDGGDRKATLQQEMDTDSVRRYLRIDVIRLSGSSRGVLLSLRDETEARLLEAMRREFIANVSHELKTPLSAIKGSAETARSAIDADDEDGAHHFLAQVDNECRRIENLIQDMMHLAKAQSGQSSFNKVPVSLRDVINESMQTNVLIAEAKTIDIAAEFRVSTE